jgi:SAM-dependent methyltransferase
MQFRESGMPPQDYWETLLDVASILDAFGFGSDTGDVAELGCGYGTFTLPLARRIRGEVFTTDIDAGMIGITRERAIASGLVKIRAQLGDVTTSGFGCAPASCDACLLFNILHCESPVEVLRAAREVVRPGGLVAVVHWRSDVPTPRGPNLAIRPSPEQIAAWSGPAGLAVDGTSFLLPPWHYGLRLLRVRTKP